MPSENNPGHSQYYTQENYESMCDTIGELDIPKGKLILLHVRLKGIKNKEQYSNLSYEDLSKLVLDVFNDLFQPKSIIVPTYTYAFTNSGIYHRLFSKSEVGRFSEEVRKNFAVYRTPDPVFSVVDTSKYLSEKKEEIDYTTAFGDSCWREHLHKENCAVVNVDIDDLRYGQLHYIENLADVEYRYHKKFEGIVYEDETNYRNIEYRYFVRDLDLDPQWDRDKIEEHLVQEGILQVRERNSIKTSRVFSQDLKNEVMSKLEHDPHFLLQN